MIDIRLIYDRFTAYPSYLPLITKYPFMCKIWVKGVYLYNKTKKTKIMGTRSTYRIIEQYKQNDSIKSNEIVLIYCQYDGYPEGHPLETAEWLSKGYVVNGLGLKDETLVFNGAGCLAAQLIAKMKDGAGNVYVYGLHSRGKCSEDYLYDIIIKSDRTIEYVAYHNDHCETEFFRGTPKEFTESFVSVNEA